MQDMIKFFDEFSKVLQEKIEAIEQNNATQLEEIMKKEQAFSMKVRGLEKAREAALEEIGLTAEDFKTMVYSPTDDEQQEVSTIYFQLKEKLNNYTTSSDIIRAQVEIKLHSIKMVLERLENAPAQGTYNKDGAENANSAKEFKATKA